METTTTATENKTCECECGCVEKAEVMVDGVALCVECASVYAYADDGTFLGCTLSGLGESCPHCGEIIKWGGIETSFPKPNHRGGSCGCGDCWRNEDRGGWGNYSYHQAEEPRET